MSKIAADFKKAGGVSVPRRGDDALEFHGHKIPDPYRHLANLDASGTQEWARAQEEKFRAFVDGNEDQSKTSAFMEKSLSAVSKGIPIRVGDQYLFYHSDGQGASSKLMISDTPEGTGRVLIDPGKDGELSSVHISPDGKHIGYRLLDPGKWEAKLVIKNIETGQDLPDNIAKSGSMWWDKDGQGIVYSHLERNKDGGQDVVLKHHPLGADPKDDAAYGNANSSPTNAPYKNHWSYQGKHEWLFTSTGDYRTSLAVKDADGDGFKPLLPGGVAKYCPIADTDDGVLMWTDHGAPNGRVVLFDPKSPAPENWKTVITESPDAPLTHAFVHQGNIFGVYNRNCADQIRIFTMDGTPDGEIPLPKQTQVDFSHANTPVSLGLPSRDTDDLMFSVKGFQMPDTTYRYNHAYGSLEKLDTRESIPGLPNCIVEQLWTKSKDGTDIPMTVIRDPSVALDGTAALRIEGYGGYGYGQKPGFDPELVDFVRSGGIVVKTHTRGGGEFGQGWHEQGKGLNKKNVVDDFIACAGHLVDKGYTSPARMVATGHSHGGFLVLASMVKRPDLFGAVIAGCPVADVLDVQRRPNDKIEFGDPLASKQSFEAMKDYCPLQNIKEGRTYPPCLIRTAENDTNLLGGAHKFTATMQHASPQSVMLLHTEQGFGHNPDRPLPLALTECARKMSFLEKTIGPIAQEDYQKTLKSAPKAPQSTRKL